MKGSVSAIVLAAGYSSRMGKFKPLLPLGDTTIIERVVDLFRKSGIKDIRVVTGYRAGELSPLLKKTGVSCIANEDFKEGMFSSVKAGVKGLDQNLRAFFILPVDIPLVRPQTIRLLLRSYEKGIGEIIYPCFHGRRGHPPLISSRFAKEITCWKGEGGLRSFLKQYEQFAADVMVADEFILFDLDKPADYQRLLKEYGRYGVPTTRECLALMTENFAVEKPVLDHCKAVSRLALGLGRALNMTGSEMDLDLLVAAGLLHDLAREQSHHATVAAQILAETGFPDVAEIVGAHMDIVIHDEDSIDEREVLYLADKLVQEDQTVPLETRFREMMEYYADEPEVRTTILLRLNNALRIKQRLETTIGKSLENILKELPTGHSDDLLA
ncbi:MAG: NTP transferase domain-containing protein [Deltaproteobacteria bacterium]|nr:NTP transferase domain-containing protein [Deltaproteobacteria bacterium]